MLTTEIREKVKQAIVEVLEEVGGGPSSVLYLVIQTLGVGTLEYQLIIDELVKENKIKRNAHWLTPVKNAKGV